MTAAAESDSAIALSIIVKLRSSIAGDASRLLAVAAVNLSLKPARYFIVWPTVRGLNPATNLSSGILAPQ